jgi:hypothetical protein
MFDLHAIIRRVAVALLFLTTGLSAQRYTGHDHAVFHRQPQPPAPVSKQHQSASPAVGGPSGRQKSPVAPAASSAQASRTSTGQAKLDSGMNHAAVPEKSDATIENSPRF